MKRLTLSFYLIIASLIIVGCSDNTNEKSVNDVSENNNPISDITDIEESEIDDKESADSDNTASENNDLDQGEESLSQYSHEQIEYARIWLQLGPNQELDEFHIQHIPAGETLNPDDETSASYPEDVIQLSGSRLGDGSITYSSNGDGTINVYKIPLRWDGVYPAGEEFYLDMLENAEPVSIEPGDDQEIIAFIKRFDVGQ